MTAPLGLPILSALFVDPGPTRSAFALLDAYASGHILVRGLWYLPDAPGWIANALLQVDAPGRARGLFGVETIRGVVYKGRNPQSMFDTKEAEARIKLSAQLRGVTAIEMPAGHWREVLLGSSVASDAQIACGVEGIFRDRATGKLELPELGRDREHGYDAVGGGMVLLAEALAYPAKLLPEPQALALRNLLRTPGGMLPRAVAAEVARIRLQEKGARDAKRFAKASGVKLPRKAPRKLTRARAEDAKNRAHATRTLNRATRGR